MEKYYIFAKSVILALLVAECSLGNPHNQQGPPIQPHLLMQNQSAVPPMQPHQLSMPVQPLQPPMSVQHHNQMHGPQKPIPPQHHDQKQARHSPTQPVPGPVPQNHPPQPQQQQTPNGYDSQVKQAFKNANAVPLPYMKYDKDDNPVLHYGHDNLDSEFGDRKANPNEYPYYVQLRTNGHHICGACLIRSPISGRPVVLTAMHCLVTPATTAVVQPHEITLRMGVNGVNDYEQERKGAVILTHSNYTLFGPSKRPSFHDIGIIITDSDFNVGAHAKFIDFPEQNLPTVWHEVTIKGFGKGREAGHDGVPTHMRTISVPVWDNEDCDKMYFEESGAHLITPAHFCASHAAGGLDSCTGNLKLT